MIKLTLDHSYYSDPGFENWQILNKCLPNELFPYQEVKHPDAICRFIALENFTLEFSDVTNNKSFEQGLCFLSKTSIFCLEDQLPYEIKSDFGVETGHKNRDWEKDLDENGELPILKKGDPRIRPGWGHLSPKVGSIHPDLDLWVGQFVNSKEHEPKPKSAWKNGKFLLKEIYLNPSVISNSFFQILASSTHDVKFLDSRTSNKPIEKIVVEVCSEYFHMLNLPLEGNSKILKSRNDHQYDLEFILDINTNQIHIEE